MECVACGRLNRPSAGYCAWCGEPLRPTAPAEPVAGPLEQGAVTRKLELPELLENDAPLPPGTWLDARYEIVALQEESADSRTYEALDRARCPGCGRVFEGEEPVAYCQECGALLEDAPRVLIVEYLVRRPERYACHWQQGDRDYYVVPLAGPGPTASRTTLRLTFGSATHQGHHYDHNEDALDARLYADRLGVSLGFFGVADGVGGQQGGEIASRLAIAAVWEHIYQAVWQAALLGQPPDDRACQAAMAEAIRKANEAVYAERTARASEMGSTLTAALLVGRRVYVGSVGDSRAYLFDSAGLRRITQDHSLVQRMVDAGQISAEEVYTHPRRNIIYRVIGDRPSLEPDTYALELAADARLLLCSDGLWEMVREDGLEEVLLAEQDPQLAADRLMENALLAGGKDNISVIVVLAEG